MRVVHHGTNMRYQSMGDIHIVTYISLEIIGSNATALWKEILIAEQFRISRWIFTGTTGRTVKFRGEKAFKKKRISNGGAAAHSATALKLIIEILSRISLSLSLARDNENNMRRISAGQKAALDGTTRKSCD